MAIQVGGTTVVNDSRALQNIASIDATTAAAITAAGVGGGGGGGFSWAVVDSGANNTLNKVVYSSSSESTKWVAVGNGGAFSYSTDPNGASWTAGTISGASTIEAVGYGNGTFVTGDSNGVIYYSSNGISWSSAGDQGSMWYDFAYNSSLSLFIAVGYGGQIKTSPNGSSWTARSSGTSRNLKGVDVNGTLTLACAQSGAYDTLELRKSTNGTSWSYQNPDGASAFNIQYQQIAYGNTGSGSGTWILSGADGKSFLSNDNGVNWDGPYTPSGGGQTVDDAIYSPEFDRFVSVNRASGGIGSVGVMGSSGRGQGKPYTNTGKEIFGIGYNPDDEVFVIVGQDGFLATS